MIQNAFYLEGVSIEGAYTEESILATKNFQSRQDDIYLLTYPRTGTTWTQNILVGMVYGLDELSQTGQSEMRFKFPYLEICFEKEGWGHEVANQITSSPRMLKSHMPSHLAPREIFSNLRKNIVVVRNPKDTALSLFKFYQTEPTLVGFKKTDDLDEFLLQIFLEGKLNCGSWWEWTKSWIEKCREYPSNHLLIHYEDLHQKFEETIGQISDFLGKKRLDDKYIQDLKIATAVDSMKARYERNSQEKDMVNKGQMNRWMSEFSPQIAEKFDDMTRKTFKDDDIAKKFI